MSSGKNLDGINPVNIADLEMLADYWLAGVSGELDIVDDGQMNELDLAVMVEYWLCSCE